MSGRRLGERLVREGRLQPEQLRRALDLQGQLGGRLGTNLLEIGAVGERPLLNALGEERSTRTASAEDLCNISAEMIRLVPAKLARRYGLVPYRREGKTLFLASVNVGDALIEDEIRLLTGCMVRTTLALELRVREALAKYYRVPTDVRITALARRLASPAVAPVPSRALPTVPTLPTPSAPPPAVPPPAVPTPPRAVPRPAPPPGRKPQSAPTGKVGPPTVQFIELDAEDEAMLRGGIVAPAAGQTVAGGEGTPADPQSGRSSAAAATASAVPLPAEVEDELAVFAAPDLGPGERLDHAAEFLQHAEIRDEIADVLLAFCAPYLERRLLLIHRQERIVGWRGDGPGVVQNAVRGIDIGVKEPSVFLSVQPPSGFWLGPLPPLPPNQRLLEGLGRFAPKDCLVLPVILRSKVVCYLYGDNGARGVAGVPVGELRRLMAKAGVAFEVYILKNKIRLM